MTRPGGAAPAPPHRGSSAPPDRSIPCDVAAIPPETLPASIATVHIGRQPVYDATGALYGYELLFRPTADATSSGIPGWDGDTATTSTILTAFSEFDPDDLLGGRLGFINLTTAFLVGEIPVPFGPEHAVLEVLETIALDDASLAGARHLVNQGYRLALDDFIWSADASAFLDLAHIVKVDVLDRDWDRIEETARACRPHGVRLLAERVEDDEMLARCKKLGFELFQGFLLGRPQTLSTESITPGDALALQLITRLGEPDTTAEQVESLLRTDPALTYRLLRIANSAAYGQTRTLSSIRDAVVLVGLAKLRAWLVLVQLSGMTGSAELLTDALVRARTCELVAGGTPGVRPEVAFTLGLLHGIAEILGLGAEGLLRSLPSLGDELEAALHGTLGPLRAVLDSVLAYQRCHTGPPSAGSDYAPDITGSYLAALAWAGTSHRDTSQRDTGR